MGMHLQVKQHNPTKAWNVLLEINRTEDVIRFISGERLCHRRATALEQKTVEGGRANQVGLD